ncbi:MAG: hypothetical protein U5N86_03190 [Planctomycetota bacterium]|nr:hypothetical protein [Planctomycetota bacterium]
MIAKYEDELSEAARNADKIERRDAIKAVRNKVLEEFVDEEAKITDRMVKSAFEDFQNDLMRKLTLTQSRCDESWIRTGVRNISIDIGLPAQLSHGSVVPARGGPGLYASCTLGTLSDQSPS